MTLAWSIRTARNVSPFLATHHYLGPLPTADLAIAGTLDDARVVAAMCWSSPTSRHLPADGTWLELSRWCLTRDAGPNAGSRMHRAAVRLLRRYRPAVTTLVSYSDPSQGHTGALYRACNWQWAPTWQRLRPPPSGQGRWSPDGAQQTVKDRWIFAVSRDDRREGVLAVKDDAAIRHWLRDPVPEQVRWARTSLAGDLRAMAS